MDYSIDYQGLYNQAKFLVTGSLKNMGNMFETVSNTEIIEPRNTQKSLSDRNKALEYHVGKNHIISELLMEQLLEIEQYGFVTIKDERYPCHKRELYCVMQSIAENNRDQWKPLHRSIQFKQKSLYHVHHDFFNGIGYHMKNQFNRKYYHKGHKFNRFKSDVDSIILKLNKESSLILEKEVLSPLITEIINEICVSSRLTGEWIVFEVRDNLVNFLCLALHEEGDDVIFNKIKHYLRF